MKFVIIFSLLSLSILINAQERPNNGTRQEDMPNDGVLKGQIFDTDLGTPVQYANVVVKKVKDGSIAYGSVADENGKFVIDKMQYGKYLVEVNFIGFSKTKKEGIIINPNNKEIDLGKVTIKQAAMQINEVEIVAERKYVEYKIDKKVINVSQDLNSVGETAVEILENTPSVETDIDGNVSLRGSGNFTVLIDGKPSMLDGTEALQQIPASIIESIEIITNPSAKYDPDGVAGIINVITIKKKEPGFNGLVNVSTDSKGGYSGDFIFNFRVNKLNVYVGGDYRNKLGPGRGNFERINTSNPDTLLYLIKDVKNSRDRFGRNAKIGLDYTFNDFNSFSINAAYGLHGHERSSLAKTTEYSFSNAIRFNDTNYITDNIFRMEEYSYEINAVYLKKFKKKGEQLILQMFRESEDGFDEEELKQFSSDVSWNYSDSDIYRQKSGEKGKSYQTRIQADYEKPLGGKGKLEAGLQTRFDDNAADYYVEVYDYETNNWAEDGSQANNLDFYRAIYSGYSTFTNSYKKLDFMLGLRGEYTDRQISSLDDTYTIGRLDYFPTFHTSYPFGKNIQVQGSYSRRINRPRSYYLDPFKNYMDPLNIRVGNPELEPEYTDSYELNFQKRFKSSFVSFETYYRKTNNLIQRVQQLLDDNIMEMTFANLDNDIALGVEMMGNVDFYKWWNLNLSFNFFNYKINGELLNTEVNQATNTWSTRFNNTFKLKKGTRIQFMMFYSGPSITAQGDRKGFMGSNIAVRQDFLKNNLSITLKVSDIFNSMEHSFTSYGENFISNFEFTRDNPVFSINLSYKINNYKQKRDGQGGGGEIETDGGGGEL